ncbi:MAG TPA: pyridoxal phosphate-dependent aminotransferase [Chloroflexota bacterium]|nr:pyridoxal phosphate-dependent aminotransferase [Chloroflexota bacterium]
MRLPVAGRMERLGTESAFEVLVRARALEARGVDVIHLEIGEPDFPTPQHIVEAGIKALRDGATHYGPPAGLPSLREAVAADVSASRKITVHPDQVVITPGGKPVLFFTMLAAIEPGDEVLLPDPGFPIYASLVNFLGGVPVPLTLREEAGFRLDLDELAAKLTTRSRLLILNSPHNPCGSALPADDLRVIADLVRGRDMVILSDEIYSRMTYGGQHSSVASQPDIAGQTIILDGFSKTYAMTGWRLGYGVFPGDFAQRIALLMTNSNSCTATFTQIAGLAALTGPQAPVEEMIAEFERRRELVVAGLNRIPGWRCRTPEGAFYAFANVRAFGVDSRHLADYFLDKAGVALLSGGGFGAAGDGYLRLSYANSRQNLEEAMRRLARATEQWTGPSL